MSMLHRRNSGQQVPWMMIGLLVILAVAVGFFAVRNVQREREHMIRSYVEHAEAMIWALEAGTRVGMGMRGGQRYMQMMVEETAKQHGIVSLALTDEDGLILAHSDVRRIGSLLPVPQGPAPSDRRSWRIAEQEDGRRVFEVYTFFAPMPDFQPRMWPEGMNCYDGPPRQAPHQEGSHQGGAAHQGGPPHGRGVVYVTQDMHTMDEAMGNELRHNVLIALLVLLVGVGSCVFLVRAEQYRRSRRQLQDSRAFASEMITSLPLGLVTTDPAGGVRLVNARAESMLGGSLRGRPLREVTGLDWALLCAELDAEGQIEDRELLVQGPQALPVSLSGSRIVNEDGVFLGHLFVLRDLREIRALQEEVRRNERLSALGHLAAGVAHEIRNPLSSIKGFATYLAGKVHGQDQEAARAMVQETDRLNRVVTELLEFARPATMRLQAADLGEVVERALRLIQADAGCKQISVVFLPRRPLPLVPLDAERLTQALLNLFLNAIQAMDQGGVLRVECEAEPGSPERVVVRIADTGCGIPAEHLDGIFNPYFTTKTSGTGLGLAIVHRIVEAHEARIAVRSQVGQGTEFTLSFAGVTRT